MNKAKKYIAAILSSVLSVACYAQQDDDGPQAFVYGTYYVCDVATQGDMDDVVEQYEKPVFDQWVADGKIQAWGYYSHFTGGRWRRLQFHVSDSLEGALNTQQNIFTEIYGNNPAGGAMRANACAAHDDYVWAATQGSGATDESPAAALSVYYVCDFDRQNRADEIVEQYFAPMYDKLVADGKISQWVWNNHLIGGRYRRLASMTGESHAAVIAARGEILQQASENPLWDEFNNICGMHSDYLWNIVH